MLATVRACAIVGLEGHIVDVEVDYNPRAGLPSFIIVGLPDAAVKESRERVRAAIKNSSLQFPNNILNLISSLVNLVDLVKLKLERRNSYQDLI